MEKMNGLKVLMIAGPTHEYLDPVRYMTNPSTGEMGFSIAQVLKQRGASVTVISGPSPYALLLKNIKVVPVVSALEMSRAVKKRIKQADVFIATAAVSDWRVQKISSQKLKKKPRGHMSLKLVANPDILQDAGTWKKKNKRAIKLIGFALETKNVLQAAQLKLKKKNLDLIIGNRPASFGSHKIKPIWVEREGPVKKMSEMTKHQLAQKIGMWIQHHG